MKKYWNVYYLYIKFDAFINELNDIPLIDVNKCVNVCTLLQGLYADSHGIIANKMYDTNFEATFSYKNDISKESRWWGGEPIWNTIRKNVCYIQILFFILDSLSNISTNSDK